MIGLNATVIGSKKWTEGDEADKKSNDNDKEEEDEDDDIKQDKKKINVKGDTMTKSEFLSLAKDLKLKLFDQDIPLKPKKTKTGSVGWSASGLKIQKEVNQILLRLQTSVNFTVKKSKSWAEGDIDNDNNEDEDDGKTQK